MFVDHSMAIWTAKHPAKKYDSKAKKACYLACLVSSPAFSYEVLSSLHYKIKEKRKDFKEIWETLSAEDREPFEKKKRDHLARQGVMKECIADALQKIKGGNCVRSYASLAKVKSRRYYFI
jgi:hypothetical protein